MDASTKRWWRVTLTWRVPGNNNPHDDEVHVVSDLGDITTFFKAGPDGWTVLYCVVLELAHEPKPAEAAAS